MRRARTLDDHRGHVGRRHQHCGHHAFGDLNCNTFLDVLCYSEPFKFTSQRLPSPPPSSSSPPPTSTRTTLPRQGTSGVHGYPKLCHDFLWSKCNLYFSTVGGATKAAARSPCRKALVWAWNLTSRLWENQSQSTNKYSFIPWNFEYNFIHSTLNTLIKFEI